MKTEVSTKLGEVFNAGLDLDAAAFHIKPENMGMVMTLFSDKIYSNKILAPIREYSTNAMDAHIENGIGNLPIEVSLPSAVSPVLVIRDYGKGLTPEEIATVYTSYCESTKRQNMDMNGCLGIGCKSGFAYSETFTVISRTGGKKYIYIAEKGSIGRAIKFEESECDEPSGIEIHVPVRSLDVSAFRKEACRLYSFFDVTPKVTNASDLEMEILNSGWKSITDKETLKDFFSEDTIDNVISICWKEDNDCDHYFSRYRGDPFVITMGNVPYDVSETLNNVISPISKISIKVKNGTVDFPPSRETLEKTERTNKFLASVKYDKIGKFLSKRILKERVRECLSGGISANSLFNLPTAFESAFSESVFESSIKEEFDGLTVVKTSYSSLGFAWHGYKLGKGLCCNFEINSKSIQVKLLKGFGSYESLDPKVNANSVIVYKDAILSGDRYDALREKYPTQDIFVIFVRGGVNPTSEEFWSKICNSPIFKSGMVQAIKLSSIVAKKRSRQPRKHASKPTNYSIRKVEESSPSLFRIVAIDESNIGSEDFNGAFFVNSDGADISFSGVLPKKGNFRDLVNIIRVCKKLGKPMTVYVGVKRDREYMRKKGARDLKEAFEGGFYSYLRSTGEFKKSQAYRVFSDGNEVIVETVRSFSSSGHKSLCLDQEFFSLIEEAKVELEAARKTDSEFFDNFSITDGAFDGSLKNGFVLEKSEKLKKDIDKNPHLSYLINKLKNGYGYSVSQLDSQMLIKMVNLNFLEKKNNIK